jgi:hypothetical protein
MTTTDREQLDTGFAKIFNALLKNLHTLAPGVVSEFDPSFPKVKVQPALQRVFEATGEPVNLPPCLDVPVVFPGSGDYWLTVDLKPGSYVLLAFSERAIAAWKTNGGVQDPEFNRMFDLSDAFAIAGILPFNEKLDSPVEPDCIALRKKDNSVSVKVESDKITCNVDNGLGSSQTLEIEATGVKAKPTGSILTTEVSAYVLLPTPGYVELGKHTHSVSGAATGPPIPTGGSTP